MTDTGPVEPPPRRRHPWRWLAVFVAVAVAAVAVGIGIGRSKSPDTTVDTFGVAVASSSLDGVAGEQLWANLKITGGPAYRLSVSVEGGSEMKAEVADTDPAALAQSPDTVTAVVFRTPLDAKSASADAKVRVTACAKDAEPCAASDRHEASTTVTAKIRVPTAKDVPTRVATPSPDRVTGGEKPTVRDEIVVITKNDLNGDDSRAAIATIAGATGGVVVGALPEAGIFQIAFPGADEAQRDAKLADVRSNPAVEFADAHRLVPVTPDRIPNEWNDSTWRSDPGGKDWNLRRISADRAWEHQTGSRDIRVAIIDGEINMQHEDLRDNAVDSQAGVYGPQVTPTEWHGTHVAGTACARGDNRTGSSGVAWECGLRGYDLGSMGIGNRSLQVATTLNIEQAMVDASKQGNLIVNMSLGFGFNVGSNHSNCGGSGVDDEAKKFVETSLGRVFDRSRGANGGRGVLWVIAAGNGCEDVQQSPPASLAAKYPDIVLPVASVDSDGSLSYFSNFGKTVTVAAGGGHDERGRQVYSTVGDCTGWRKTLGQCDSYKYMSGTSMATPAVTGVAALVAAQHRDFSATQIRECIDKSAAATSVKGPNEREARQHNLTQMPDVSNMGIVDAEAAVLCDGTPPGGTGPPPSLPPGSPNPPPTAPAPTKPPDQFQAPQTVVIVDTSDSMNLPDASGKVVKIDGAKAALTDFVNGLSPTAEVGLWTYPNPNNVTSTSGGCSTGGPLIGSIQTGTQPLDRAAMSAKIRSLTATGDTPTAAALAEAAKMFRGTGPRTIVLVSDGEKTCGDEPCPVAQNLAAQGITAIYTVGFQLSPEGKTEMQCIADAGHGSYTDVTTGDQLIDKMPELARAKLDLTMTLPERTAVDIGTGQPSTGRIEAKVTNNGNNDAYDVQLDLAFDSNAGSIGSGRKRLGNLAKGETRSVSWDFRPKEDFGDKEVEFTVNALAVNADLPPPVSAKTKVTGSVSVDQAGPLLKGKSNPVVLGDSYSSGEGAFDYDPETDTKDNACHRSRATYAADLFPDALISGDHTRHVFACSGAIAADIWQSSKDNKDPDDHSRQLSSQVDQMRNDPDFKSNPPDVALLTIGGNDIGFKQIIIDCLMPGNCDTNNDVTTRTQTYLDGLPQSLRTAYTQIDAAVNSADAMSRRGNVAPIIVLGYPQAFPEADAAVDDCTHNLATSERKWVTGVADDLNNRIASTVAALRAQGYPLYFVPDTRLAMRPDHTLCSREPWINDVDKSLALISMLHESAQDWRLGLLDPVHALWLWGLIDDPAYRAYAAGFHPSTNGYKALAAALVHYSNSPPAQVPATHATSSPPSFGGQKRGYVELTTDGGGASQTVHAGETYGVTARGLQPYAQYEVVVASDPQVLARGTADAQGSIDMDLTLPPDLPTGDHHLSLVAPGPQGTEQRTQALAVSEPVVWWWWAVGLLGVLGVFGGLIVLRRTRRIRSADDPAVVA